MLSAMAVKLEDDHSQRQALLDQSDRERHSNDIEQYPPQRSATTSPDYITRFTQDEMKSQRKRKIRTWTCLSITGIVAVVAIGALSAHPNSAPLMPNALTSPFRPSSQPIPSQPYDIDWFDLPRGDKSLSNAYGFLPRPRIGTQEWKKLYPRRTKGPDPRPAWLARYRYLKQKGDVNTFTTVPKATLNMNNGLAEYPSGTVMGPTGVCSYRRAACFRSDRTSGMPYDIFDGKTGTYAVNFDDGPLPPSRTLYDFLEQENLKATHFWIGSNVVDYTLLALEASVRGDELLVHTWSHAHLTTLTDEELLGELGWTVQVIADVSGSVPKYYRPPYGDTDDRVRAVASVLGLTTILWNGDSADWSLNQTWATGDFVDPPMGGFGVEESKSQIREVLNRPVEKGPGPIILEHELSEESVRAFTDTVDHAKQRGWQLGTVQQCVGY